MNLKEVAERAQRVRDMDGDPEVAHGAEDALVYDVLRAIADGKTRRPRLLASHVVALLDEDHVRWYA